jgi:hypothetical protein
MRHLQHGLWIFIIFSLIGCNGIYNTPLKQPIVSQSINPLIATQPVIKTSIVNETRTLTEIPIKSPSPTPTINVPVTTLDTKTPTKTVFITPQVNLIKKCIDISPTGNSKIINTGSIYFTWLGGVKTGVASLDSNSTNPKIFKTDISTFDFFVSPYTGTIAWIDKSNFMNFQRSNGNLYQVKLDKSWGYFRQWLADDRVILAPAITENVQGYFPANDNLYILTPDTGQVEHYYFEMPEYFSTIPVAAAIPSGPLYDPSFRRAIYAMNKYNATDEGMLLWNTQNMTEIWRMDGYGYSSAYGGINWRVDGEKAVFSAPDIFYNFSPELYSVTIDGVTTQLTQLNRSIHNPYMIFEVSWSPNGRYIAFVVNEDRDHPLDSRVLYILDLEYGEVKNYCISPVIDLVWSPNNDQLAFIYNANQLVIMNIDSGSAQSVDDAIKLYGWSGWLIQ